jgi:hypothetical protein
MITTSKDHMTVSVSVPPHVGGVLDYKTHQHRTKLASTSLSDTFRFCLYCFVCCFFGPFRGRSTIMSSVPLAQSADKQVLFARLGLNENIHRLLLVRIRSHFLNSFAKLTACIARGPTREGQLESKFAKLDRPIESEPFDPDAIQVG